jgi:SpoVK/Ycf46/Vps4 family AAA+-type ATPase
VLVLPHRKVVFFSVHQVWSIIYFINRLFVQFLGTGKTLLARAVASQLDCNFLKVVSSAIVDKYIGESARMIREMFAYAKDHQPCIIFMDEIDAIGGRRFSEGTSADREIQRTLMEVRSLDMWEMENQFYFLAPKSNGWIRYIGKS